MSSNLRIRITLDNAVSSEVLMRSFTDCISNAEFFYSEDISSINSRACRVGPNGHEIFVLLKNNWNGGVNVRLKFNDYDSVNAIFFEPAGRLVAGCRSYSEQDANCLLSLYQLTECLYERLNVLEAIAMLDDVDEPWFRLSKIDSFLPLPTLSIDSDGIPERI